MEPWDYSANTVTLINTGEIFEEEESCRSYLTGGETEAMKSSALLFEAKADSVNEVLAVYVDGGDTEELNTDIDNSTPPGANELRQQLLNESPYLSDTVMINAVQQENVLESAMIRDVLVTNPQSAKSEKVMDELDQRFNPLPEYMIDEIEQGRFSVSSKENLEAAYSHYAQKKRNYTNRVIKNYLYDTIHAQQSRDSLKAFLSRQDDLYDRYQLIFMYIDEGEYTAANQSLSSVPTDFDLSSKEQSDYLDYQVFAGILMDLKQNQAGFAQLDSSQKQSLFALASGGDNYVSAYARNIMHITDTLEYEELIVLPGMVSVQNYEPGFVSQEQEDIFNIFPNPARDYFTVEYKTSKETQRVYMELIDHSGRLVRIEKLEGSHNQRIIETGQLAPGVYMLRFSASGKMLQSMKLNLIN